MRTRSVSHLLHLCRRSREEAIAAVDKRHAAFNACFEKAGMSRDDHCSFQAGHVYSEGITVYSFTGGGQHGGSYSDDFFHTPFCEKAASRFSSYRGKGPMSAMEKLAWISGWRKALGIDDGWPLLLEDLRHWSRRSMQLWQRSNFLLVKLREGLILSLELQGVEVNVGQRDAWSSSWSSPVSPDPNRGPIYEVTVEGQTITIWGNDTFWGSMTHKYEVDSSLLCNAEERCQNSWEDAPKGYGMNMAQSDIRQHRRDKKKRRERNTASNEGWGERKLAEARAWWGESFDELHKQAMRGEG